MTPGTLVDRYRVTRRIGAGGMGVVYEAVHVQLEKRVALKLMNADRARDPKALGRFIREGRAAARVRHPNAVEVSDVGVHDGTPYLVMEYLEGEDLASRIAREGPLPVAELADLMLPVLAAVAAAHDVGVLHRDLKPANVFLARVANRGFTPRVVDFGVSRMLHEEGEKLTSTGAIVGTPAYMAPEQAAGGDAAVSPASDQYALGAILYEGATGRAPFEGPTPWAVLLKVGRGDFPRPRALAPAIPANFETLVLRAMSLDPAARFPSVRAMAEALLPFATERGRRVDPLPAPRLPARSALRIGALVAAASALGLLAARLRPAPPSSENYDVSVTASPESAVMVLDGEPIPSRSLRRRFAADGRQHVLRVSAIGYAPQEIAFTDGPPSSSVVVLRRFDGRSAVALPPLDAAVQPAVMRTDRARHPIVAPTDAQPLSPTATRGHDTHQVPSRHDDHVDAGAPFRASIDAGSREVAGVDAALPSARLRPALRVPGVVVPPEHQPIRSPFDDNE